LQSKSIINNLNWIQKVLLHFLRFDEISI